MEHKSFKTILFSLRCESMEYLDLVGIYSHYVAGFCRLFMRKCRVGDLELCVYKYSII